MLFTSSSTVRNLVGIAGKPHERTVLGAIGPHTAETIAEHGLRLDVMAPEPSVTVLVDALAEFAVDLEGAGAGRPPVACCGAAGGDRRVPRCPAAPAAAGRPRCAGSSRRCGCTRPT